MRAVLLGLVWQQAAAAAGLDQRDLCALLCTSTATAAAVETYCQFGTVDVAAKPYSVKQASRFAAWVRKHASLLRSLTLEPQATGSTGGLDQGNWEAGTLVADALATAEAQGQLGHLTALSCPEPYATIPFLHQGLPSSLTRLDMCWLSCTATMYNLPQHRWTYPLGAGLMPAAGLKSLALNLGSDDDEIKSLRVACGHLSHLTELELAGEYAPDDYQPLLDVLPTGLHRLVLHYRNMEAFDMEDSDMDDYEAQGFEANLSRFTALKELNLGKSQLCSGAVLPTSLATLGGTPLLPHCLDVLKPLKNLQHLSGGVHAEYLVELAGSVTGLTDVELMLSQNTDYLLTPAGWVDPDYDPNLQSVVGKLVDAGLGGAVRKVCVHDGDSDDDSDRSARGLLSLQLLPHLCDLTFRKVEVFEWRYLEQLTDLKALTRLDLTHTYPRVLKRLPEFVSCLPNLQQLLLPGRYKFCVGTRHRVTYVDHVLRKLSRLHSCRVVTATKRRSKRHDSSDSSDECGGY